MLNRSPLLALALLGLANTASPQARPVAPTITLLARTYQLGSFNQKNQATWEFITAGERIDNWTTLVTIIDRPDAHTRQELDRLAEGIMSNYKSHGGHNLLAKTLSDQTAAALHNTVAALAEQSKDRH